MPYYEYEHKLHTEDYYCLKELIEGYINASDENEKEINVSIIRTSEYFLISCTTEEMVELMGLLNKESPVYKILFSQIKNYINELPLREIPRNPSIRRPCEDIFDIKKYLGQFDDFKSITEQYIQEHMDKVIERIYDCAFTKMMDNFESPERRYAQQYYANVEAGKMNLVMPLIKSIMIDACERQGIKFKDIEKIGSGCFSNVYGVGDEVIKIARDRDIWEIPDNPYMLRPIIRKRIKLDDFTNDPYDREFEEQGILRYLYIEVTERADTIEIGNSQDFEEELYDLYVKLRKIGIIWLDVRPENVGRLKKTQGSPLASNEELSITDNPKYTEKIMLPAGSLVIVDADSLCSEEEFDFDYVFPKNNYEKRQTLSYKFYKRYEEEHFIGPRRAGR